MLSKNTLKFLLLLSRKKKKMYNEEALQYPQLDERNFVFLLLMGGCARKASFRMSDLECHNRPFLVGSSL
jgi:hypothetical protein